MGEKLTAIVDDHLRGCLPPGVPPSYRTIVAAKKRRSEGGAPTITADVIMFDGQAAKVVLTEHRPLRSAPAPMRFSIWSHRWLMGSAVYWEDGTWHREPEMPLDLFGFEYCESGRAALSREEGR